MAEQLLDIARRLDASPKYCLREDGNTFVLELVPGGRVWCTADTPINVASVPQRSPFRYPDCAPLPGYCKPGLACPLEAKGAVQRMGCARWPGLHLSQNERRRLYIGQDNSALLQGICTVRERMIIA